MLVLAVEACDPVFISRDVLDRFSRIPNLVTKPQTYLFRKLLVLSILY